MKAIKKDTHFAITATSNYGAWYTEANSCNIIGMTSHILFNVLDFHPDSIGPLAYLKNCRG